MKTEEAVLEGEAFGEFVFEDGMNPCGVVSLVAVTVVLIVHQFAGVDTLLLVNLPEDDATFFGGTEAVTVGSMVHLLGGEVALRDEGLAEGGLSGEGFGDERWVERDKCGGVRGGSPDRRSALPLGFAKNLSPVRVRALNDGDIEFADEPVAGFDEGEVLVVLH